MSHTFPLGSPFWAMPFFSQALQTQSVTCWGPKGRISCTLETISSETSSNPRSARAGGPFWWSPSWRRSCTSGQTKAVRNGANPRPGFALACLLLHLRDCQCVGVRERDDPGLLLLLSALFSWVWVWWQELGLQGPRPFLALSQATCTKCCLCQGRNCSWVGLRCSSPVSVPKIPLFFSYGAVSEDTWLFLPVMPEPWLLSHLQGVLAHQPLLLPPPAPSAAPVLCVSHPPTLLLFSQVCHLVCKQVMHVAPWLVGRFW